MIHDLLSRAIEIIPTSPLRQNSNLPLDIPEEQKKSYLEDVEKDLETLEKNLELKLSLVLMGEVKAGKSTLINALVGKALSPVNTLECTSSIIEIEYSKTPYAEIYKKDGSVERPTFEEISKILTSQESRNFMENCRLIKIGHPLEALKKLRLVDTPGLASITEENENITKNYIMSADFILWVLNANTLGDVEITNQLSWAAKMGKPIVIILNKKDQVDDPEKAKSYVEEEYGIYSEKVFCLSAKEAYEAVISGDEELKEKSGIKDLVEFLESQLNAKQDEVKLKSAISSFESLMRREVIFHKTSGKRILFLENQIKSYEQDLRSRAEKVNLNLENWIKGRVYGVEGPGLLEALMSATRRGNIDEGRIKEEIENWWEKVLQDLEVMFKKEWETSESEYLSRFDQGFDEFVKNMRIDYIYEANERELNDTGLEFSKLKEQLKNGANAALALSAFLSILPSVTFIGALSTLLPLGLIVGTISALSSKSSGKEKDIDLSMNIDVENVRRRFVTEFLEPQVIPQIKNLSEKLIEKRLEQIFTESFKGYTREKLSRFLQELKEYVERVDDILERVRSFNLS